MTSVGAETTAPAVEDKADVNAEVDGVQPEDADYIQKRKNVRAATIEKRKAFAVVKEAEIRKLQDERAEKIEKLHSADTATIDGKIIKVDEPKDSQSALKLTRPVRDEFAISPDDFEILVHDRWSINKTDFRFDRPLYTVADIRSGHTKRWFMFTYSITNSTTAPRRFAPVFVAATDKGVFSPDTSSLIPLRRAADSTMHPLAESKAVRDAKWNNEGVVPMEAVQSMVTKQLKDGEFKGDPSGQFEPGQTRWGAAIWPNFNDEWTELKIIIHGLNNAHRYDRKQRRVLVLTFSRKDDEFHVERSLIRYVSKEWEYLWMWDQDISIPVPADPSVHQIKDKVIATPSGAQRLMLAFPYLIENSSQNDQTLTVKQIRMELRGPKTGDKYAGFEVEVGGTKVTINEVPIVDDGRSTIYKAQFLREIGMAVQPRDTDRFAPDAAKSRQPGYGRVYEIKAGAKLDNQAAVFDAGSDVDWKYVREQVEDMLTLSIDKKALNEQNVKAKLGDKKLPAGMELPLYAPRRVLTDDTLTLIDGRGFSGDVTFQDETRVVLVTREGAQLEFKKSDVKSVEDGEFSKVKAQILAKLPAAVETAKTEKKVVASFACDCGLASGTYRIMRSYHKPGVIQEEWINAWQTLEENK